MTFDYFIDQIV